MNLIQIFDVKRVVVFQMILFVHGVNGFALNFMSSEKHHLLTII